MNNKNKILTIFIFVMACFFNCSENKSESMGLNSEPPIDKSDNLIEKSNLKVEIIINKVGVLAKKSSIRLKELKLTLTADGEETVTETIPLIGNSDGQSVTQEFSLAGYKEWTVHAKTVDENNIMIHETVLEKETN